MPDTPPPSTISIQQYHDALVSSLTAEQQAEHANTIASLLALAQSPDAVTNPDAVLTQWLSISQQIPAARTPAPTQDVANQLTAALAGKTFDTREDGKGETYNLPVSGVEIKPEFSTNPTSNSLIFRANLSNDQLPDAITYENQMAPKIAEAVAELHPALKQQPTEGSAPGNTGSYRDDPGVTVVVPIGDKNPNEILSEAILLTKLRTQIQEKAQGAEAPVAESAPVPIAGIEAQPSTFAARQVQPTETHGGDQELRPERTMTVGAA